ncbi:MetQ/NlpA family ABC transporter substrate-binding protein [Acholeplasma vituli]|uniref:MetQ/NlpA family ABC transporter substrate-binding protein n=1 Tax=Paracholeplasma vituli TaxID=69473 RepID=A0ABT2PVQ3_9MOLU|nr:MetQ/NlpA family ABC transporter substrate-binding protein [Paracholeplasma vituli]MCU0104915.1 MetQ/NlpA family ABC transporter substrate-binding protein [Paracholeplasma vituli]
MKRIITLITLLTTILTLAGCQDNKQTIKVIATSKPHAEILNFAKPLLKARGYDLKVIVTSDYYFPNPAVAAGDADANFFQHVPFLTKYNLDNPNKTLEIASYVHIEPIGLYANTIASLDAIPNGSKVLLSNSTSDHGRALNLLAQAGLIALSEDFDILSTSINFSEVITSNPKNLVIEANVSPDFLISAYNSKEADLYIINSNYALEGNLNPLIDSIFIESTGNNPYVNIVAVTPSLLNSDKIKALAEILNSQAVKDFITTTYGGSVIPYTN